MNNPIKTLCFLSLFIAQLSWIGCANQSDIEVIKYDLEDTKELLLNIDIHKIISLETTKGSLIGNTSSIKFFNGKYYVLDRKKTKSLFVFDEEGNFINKTQRGLGPGEVNEPYAVTFDENSGNVLLHDQGIRAIHTLDPDLKYLSTKRIKDVYIKDFYKLKNDRFLVYHMTIEESNLGKMEYNPYSLYTNDFSAHKDLNIRLQRNITSQDLLSPVCINEEILFVSPWNYNIYQLVKNTAKVRYRMDFGKFNFSDKDLSTKSGNEMWEMVHAGIKIGSVGTIIKNDNYLVSINVFNGEALTYFHSFSSNRNFKLKHCIENGLIPDCIIWGMADQDTYFGVIEPSQLMKFQEENDRFSNLVVTENENPFIVLFNVSEQ